MPYLFSLSLNKYINPQKYVIQTQKCFTFMKSCAQGNEDQSNS